MEKRIKKIIAARYAGLLPHCSRISNDLGITYQGLYYLLRGRFNLSLAKFISICQSEKLDPVAEFKAIIKQLKTEEKNEK